MCLVNLKWSRLGPRTNIQNRLPVCSDMEKEFTCWRSEILMAGTYENCAQSGWQTYIRSSKTTGAQNQLSKRNVHSPTFNVFWIIGNLKHQAHNNVQLLHMNVSGSIWLLLWTMYRRVHNFSFVLENSQSRCSFSYDGSKKTTSTKMSCRNCGGRNWSLGCDFLWAPHLFPYLNIDARLLNYIPLNTMPTYLTWEFASVAKRNIAPKNVQSVELLRIWLLVLWHGVGVCEVLWLSLLLILAMNRHSHTDTKTPENNVCPNFCTWQDSFWR